MEAEIKDPQEKAEMFRSIETTPFVTRKANWALRWINYCASFEERLVAFAIVEGIVFRDSATPSSI